MTIDWKIYTDQAGHEIRIIFTYSVIIAVFTLSLEFIQWDHDLLLSFMHLLVFFAIAHTEDRSTVDLSWKELMTRLVTSIIFLILSRGGALFLKQNYLSNDLSNYDSDTERPSLIMLTIVVEYLDAVRILSSARIYIIAVILIIFGAPILSSLIQAAVEFIANNIR